MYSQQGFIYCDLLLAETERAAWKRTHAKARSREEENLGALAASRVTPDRLQAVSDRATKTLKIADRNNWLLDIALDHLTLGPAALYEAILTGSRLVPRLRLGTHCPRGSASQTREECEIDSTTAGIEAEPHEQRVPRPEPGNECKNKCTSVYCPSCSPCSQELTAPKLRRLATKGKHNDPLTLPLWR